MLDATKRTKDFKGLGLNLQLFADDSAGKEGVDESSTVEEKEEKAGVKTFTEDEVEKRIQSESDKRVTEALKTAREKWEKEKAEEKKEADRLAKLTQEERERELREKQEKELQEAKAELQKMCLERDTIDRLNEDNVPIVFKDFLMGADAESTNENIKSFKKVFEETVQKEVESRLKGKTPGVATGNKKMDAWSVLSDKYE